MLFLGVLSSSHTAAYHEHTGCGAISCTTAGSRSTTSEVATASHGYSNENGWAQFACGLRGQQLLRDLAWTLAKVSAGFCDGAAGQEIVRPGMGAHRRLHVPI